MTACQALSMDQEVNWSLTATRSALGATPTVLPSALDAQQEPWPSGSFSPETPLEKIHLFLPGDEVNSCVEASQSCNHIVKLAAAYLVSEVEAFIQDIDSDALAGFLIISVARRLFSRSSGEHLKLRLSLLVGLESAFGNAGWLRRALQWCIRSN